MRVLIAVVSALLAVVQCAPQYGYQQPILGSSSPVISGSDLLALQQQLANGQQQLIQHGNGGGGGGGNKYLPPANTTPAPIINKQFYLISPPEDKSNAGKTKHLVLGRPQKNYRVVFIKAPVPDNDGVKYSAEFAPQEEKTVIYVLSKKPEDIDASNIATPAPTQASKPEVFFIKYKTDEEANQAQKEIQDQYDKLDGPNEIHAETTAPITSIVGSLDGLNSDGSYNYRPINKENVDADEKPSAQYLPALFKH